MYGNLNRGRGLGGGRDASHLLWLLPLIREIERMPVKPIITIGTLGLLCWIHMNHFSAYDWGVSRVCISAAGFRATKGLFAAARLGAASALSHGSDTHLVVNLLSFLHKAAQLEAAWGPFCFTLTLLGLTVGTQLIYSPLAVALGKDSECAVGFSGVIFALKILCQSQLPGNEWARVAGYTVPAAAAAWIELIVIQLASPHTSFVAHLSGILVGLLGTQVIFSARRFLSYQRRHPPPHLQPQPQNHKNPWRCKVCKLRNAHATKTCTACSTPNT